MKFFLFVPCLLFCGCATARYVAAPWDNPSPESYYQENLDALKAAHDAGVMTDAQYAQAVKDTKQ